MEEVGDVTGGRARRCAHALHWLTDLAGDCPAINLANGDSSACDTDGSSSRFEGGSCTVSCDDNYVINVSLARP